MSYKRHKGGEFVEPSLERGTGIRHLSSWFTAKCPIVSFNLLSLQGQTEEESCQIRKCSFNLEEFGTCVMTTFLSLTTRTLFSWSCVTKATRKINTLVCRFRYIMLWPGETSICLTSTTVFKVIKSVWDCGQCLRVWMTCSIQLEYQVSTCCIANGLTILPLTQQDLLCHQKHPEKGIFVETLGASGVNLVLSTSSFYFANFDTFQVRTPARTRRR